MKATLPRGYSETRDRFGYQWTRFHDLTPEFESHFHAFLGPMDPIEFAGKVVLDAGCGYGRYALYAAKYGAQVVGLDFSEALVSARGLVRAQKISLVQGDILRPPFPDAGFDIVMSLGVLHHLPDPFEGFVRLRRCVAPGGAMVIWLYSAKRRFSNALVEVLRRLVRRLPNDWLRLVALLLAVPDFWLSKSSAILRILLGEHLWRKVVPTHFRLYAGFPFRVCWADWFDRLGAPIRHYHTKEELENWISFAGAKGSVTPTEDYGWTVVARFPE